MPVQKTITEYTLFKRVKHALREPQGDEEPLVLYRCAYNSRWFNELGRYYITTEYNVIEACHQDLDSLAEELGVLKPHETVIPE